MMKKQAFLALCMATFAATPASAQEFSGATITFENRNNGGTSQDDQLHFEGSAAMTFGSGVALQFGLKYDNYKPDNFESTGYDLHANYALSESVILGAFYGREEFDGSKYKYAGVEADFSFGQFGLQASISKYQDADDSANEATYSTLDARYNLNDRFSILAGYHHSDYNGSLSYSYLGGSARIYDGLDLTAKYGSLGGDFSEGQDILSVGISFSLKGGVVFNQRTYTNLLPTD